MITKMISSLFLLVFLSSAPVLADHHGGSCKKGEKWEKEHKDCDCHGKDKKGKKKKCESCGDHGHSHGEGEEEHAH